MDNIRRGRISDTDCGFILISVRGTHFKMSSSLAVAAPAFLFGKDTGAASKWNLEVWAGNGICTAACLMFHSHIKYIIFIQLRYFRGLAGEGVRVGGY